VAGFVATLMSFKDSFNLRRTLLGFRERRSAGDLPEPVEAQHGGDLPPTVDAIAEDVAVEPLVESESLSETPSAFAAPYDAAEAALIEQARNDPAAFGLLYERYVDRIYSYMFHRVGNVQDAEDLTARTFYRALDKLDTYVDRGLPFAAWLFRIAHNLVANWHRDRGRRKQLPLDKMVAMAGGEASPHEQVEQLERHDALWAAINMLPEERRNLLLYKFSSRLSNLEIGELMNKSESAIKSLYFRTLAGLRKELESRGWGERMEEFLPEMEDEAGEPLASQPVTRSRRLLDRLPGRKGK
jgi:RNA polymerase sigma-70 factor (ECF subfamily)